MADEAPSGGTPPEPRTIEHTDVRPPGGCGCGVTGCMTLMVAVCAILLIVMIYMALARPGLTPGAP